MSSYVLSLPLTIRYLVTPQHAYDEHRAPGRGGQQAAGRERQRPRDPDVPPPHPSAGQGCQILCRLLVFCSGFGLVCRSGFYGLTKWLKDPSRRHETVMYRKRWSVVCCTRSLYCTVDVLYTDVVYGAPVTVTGSFAQPTHVNHLETEKKLRGRESSAASSQKRGLGAWRPRSRYAQSPYTKIIPTKIC